VSGEKTKGKRMQTREAEERDVFCGSEDVSSEKRKKPKAREAEEREMCFVEVKM
jgi:hypothetical protein